MKKQQTSASRRRFLKNAVLGAGTLASYRFLNVYGGPYPALPDAAWNNLPRWRGFNLLNYFMEFQQYPFEERVFQDIADCGFNFVRIPLDYRCWIEDGDWNRLNSEKIDSILQALEFGEKYSIHVMLNFHRAPGYTVAQPAEAKPLWTDIEAQEVCCRHWAEFARRCAGIPNSHLSFNLFNEPQSSSEEEILPATIKVIEAVRAEDADRLIVCDGMRWGREPISGLVPYKIAQSTRGYDPMFLTHYKASWVNCQDFNEPSWPNYSGNGLLISPHKTEMAAGFHQPLSIEGPFNDSERLRMKVNVVSDYGILAVEADGREIFRRELTPGKGPVEWDEEHWSEWNIWQNRYNLDLFADIPAGTQKIAIRNLDGDWISLSELGMTSASLPEECRISMFSAWSDPFGKKLSWSPSAGWNSEFHYDRETLWNENVRPWVDFQQQSGTGVIVGEFGVFNQTPHDIALRWMEDCLANWQKAGFGWALWNWSGSIGVVESTRPDVTYTPWRTWHLDQKMLELLQRY